MHSLTYERYQTTLKLLKEFVKHQYGKEDMSLPELKYGFITDLEFRFKTIRKCSHNTTIKYITNLRKIINLAIMSEEDEKKIREYNQQYLKSRKESILQHYEDKQKPS